MTIDPSTPLLKRRLITALRRTHLKGASWNWAHWPAVLKQDAVTITLAAVPLRFVQLIEQGALNPQQVATTLALRSSGGLKDTFTAYADLWLEAVVMLLGIRQDAKRAALYGRAALDLALAGKWQAAFEPAWAAAEVERAYTGRAMRWRPFLYVIAKELLRSLDGDTRDPRLRSVAQASAGAARP